MPNDPVDEVLGQIFAGNEHLLHSPAPKVERFDRPLRQALLSIHLRSAEKPIKYPEAHGAFPQDRLSVVPPIVPDANRLRNDILYACRTGRRTVLVNAANAGLFRLFCAKHVVDEVAEHSAEWATESEVDLTTFLHLWLVEYLPLIRVLRNDDLPPTLLTAAELARVEKLRVNDPDDVPSVTLALSIGAFYLSGDGHALAAVYGPDVDLAEHDKWLEVLKAGGDAGELSEMLKMATAIVGGIGSAAAYGTQALWRRFGVVGILPILAVVFLLYTRMRPETKAKVGSATATAFETIAEVYSEHQSVLIRFQRAAPDSPTWGEMAETMTAPQVLLRCSLHTLARVGLSNCSARDLRAALPDVPVPHGEAKVRDVLRRNSCFAEAWRGRWQVGQIAQPLGRLLARTEEPGAVGFG